MDELARLENLIIVAANLLALSMSFGLMFAVLVQPRRDATSYTFALFCLSLGSWATSSLLSAIPQLRYGLSDLVTVELVTSAVGLTSAAFFLFVMVFVKPQGIAARWFGRLAPFAFLIGMLLVWSGQFYTNVRLGFGLESLEFTAIGYIVIAVIVAYLLASFWFLVSSPQERARWLRIPALLLALAYASDGISVLLPTPVDMILATTAAVWMGWAVLHFQLFDPLNQLNTDLRSTNRSLQQAVDDLAGQKRHTEQLNRELLAANQYKNEFVANMSHELRTPLNSIIGYSELLEGGIYGDLNERQLDRVEKIHRNGQHLLVLIDSILDLNKLDAGRLILDKTPFPVQAVIEHLTAVFQPQCSARSLGFVVNTEPHLPVLYGDQRRIIQGLSNLLNNALKFTKTGQIILDARTVGVVNGDTAGIDFPPPGGLSNGNWLLVRVTDTGIGIPLDYQSHIFEPFTQADTGLNREFEGAGLGLTITKRLVEMHGGVIWLRSTPGSGSTFYVALPCDVEKMRAVSPAER